MERQLPQQGKKKEASTEDNTTKKVSKSGNFSNLEKSPNTTNNSTNNIITVSCINQFTCTTS